MTASSNIHVLFRKASDAGALSGGAWEASAPLTNLQTQDVKEVARSSNVLAASTQFRIDGGASPRQSWSMFAMLGHTATTAARWRIVCTDDPADAPGNRLHDSGEMPVWEPTVTFGSLPWGVFPWDGVDTQAYPTHPLAFYVAETSTLARYVFIYVTDTANPAGYLDIGRFIAGEAWAPGVNVEYGNPLGWVDPSEARRTEGGRRIIRQRAKYRSAEIEFRWLSAAEAWGTIFEWTRLGKGHDVLFVSNPNDPPDIRFKRSFYGALRDVAPITDESFDLYGCRLTIEELP